MSKDYVLYRNGDNVDYASSIAATWIWAPALYVSSQMAHNYGLQGLAWFLIPNVITLLIFGYFAKLVRAKVNDGVSLQSVIGIASARQSRLHTSISVVLLLCSTIVQFVGIHILLKDMFGLDKVMSTFISGTIAYFIVRKNGIKSCIINDRVKYTIILVIGFILTAYACIENPHISPIQLDTSSSIDLALSFGVITTIGLLSAPYVDNTFWQRAFSIPKEKVFSTFVLSGLFFLVIPLLFGIIGLVYTDMGDKTWQITSAFDSIGLRFLLGVAIFVAIISTIDSNLCAISSLYYRHVVDVDMVIDTKDQLRGAMFLLLTASGGIFVSIDVTITQMFLLYGTIRTCAAVPTILIILDKYDKSRLFFSTLATVCICCPGYIIASKYGYGFIFTVLALFIPLLGLSVKK